MDFAIATNDAQQGVLESFLAAGWRLRKLFVSANDWLDGNEQVIRRALELGAEVQHSPITAGTLATLGAGGCRALLVANYSWKIPGWQEHLDYAVNFHPSPLPEGRGPYPYVRAILEQHTSWAVTCHRINDRFDAGDIIAAETFGLEPDEQHETLRLKTQMAARRLAQRLAADFEGLYAAARPQQGGSYWPPLPAAASLLDFSQPVATIARLVRAYGSRGCRARVNGIDIYVRRAQGWQERHDCRPGAVIHSSNLSFVIAAADGYVAVTEWSLYEPGALQSNVPR